MPMMVPPSRAAAQSTAAAPLPSTERATPMPSTMQASAKPRPLPICRATQHQTATEGLPAGPTVSHTEGSTHYRPGVRRTRVDMKGEVDGTSVTEGKRGSLVVELGVLSRVQKKHQR